MFLLLPVDLLYSRKSGSVDRALVLCRWPTIVAAARDILQLGLSPVNEKVLLTLDQSALISRPVSSRARSSVDPTIIKTGSTAEEPIHTDRIRIRLTNNLLLIKPIMYKYKI